VPTHKPREGILNKKQNIIQPPHHLFVEQGFEGTTTLQLANEAGVTEPLIYYHFKAKDQLSKITLRTTGVNPPLP